jgi:hypothetical protein
MRWHRLFHPNTWDASAFFACFKVPAIALAVHNSRGEAYVPEK